MEKHRNISDTVHGHNFSLWGQIICLTLRHSATTHVEKVVAVIITTLTLNIVQYVTVGLEQSLVLATNNFLCLELHRLHTPWIREATKGYLNAIVSILNTQSM